MGVDIAAHAAAHSTERRGEAALESAKTDLKAEARPEAYETHCPACFEVVVFSLMRDTNNLMCPHCANLFDAGKVFRQAEVLAAIIIQKDARGALARKLQRGKRSAVAAHRPSGTGSTLVKQTSHRPQRSSTEELAIGGMHGAMRSSSPQQAGKVRPENYVTRCPACYGDVHFSLIRDSNNLCCTTCTNVFDATVVYKQAEVLAAIKMQKVARGRLERNKMRFATKLLEQGRRYHAACPVCKLVISFVPHANDTVGCPNCHSIFNGARALRLTSTEVRATVRIQRHARGKLARSRRASMQTQRQLSHDSAEAAEKPPLGWQRRSSIEQLAAEHVVAARRMARSSTQALMARPELYSTQCPACFDVVHFSLIRDSNNLCCTTCTNVFNATKAFRQAEVVAALIIQKNVRGRLERNKLRFRKKLLTMGKRYSTACPVCKLVIRFTPHKSDIVGCPNCNSVFEGTKAMFSIALDVLATVRIQRHMRGNLARRRIRQLRSASSSRNVAAHRPEMYVTRCPACLGNVHFSLIRDSNNLCCTTCTNVFDATIVYKQAEVLAAIKMQRVARGRLERNKMRFATKLLERGRRYHAACPVCKLVISFVPHANDTVGCPNCHSIFNGAKAVRVPNADSHAATCIQRYARGKLSRHQSTAEVHEVQPLPVQRFVFEELPPVEPLPPRVIRPDEEYETHCPSCAGSVRFGLVRTDSRRHLLCPYCSNLFDAKSSYLVAQVVAAMHIQAHARGQLERNRLIFGERMLMHKKYSVNCPNCSSTLSVRPHSSDTAACPHCASIFSMRKALKARSLPVFSAIKMQRFARGRIVRNRMRRSRAGTQLDLDELEPAASAQMHHAAARPARLSERPEEEEEEENGGAAEQVLAALAARTELIASRCTHCDFSGAVEREIATGMLTCPACAATFTEAEVAAQADAARRIQQFARGRVTREERPTPAAALVKSLTTPQLGELNRSRCPSCSVIVTFRPHGASDLTVCPSCSTMFSGQAAMEQEATKAALDIQRWVRGKEVRSAVKQLKRSMRPSQLVRARSAVGLGRRPGPLPPPEEPPPPPQQQLEAVRPRPGRLPGSAGPPSPGQIGVTRLNMSRPSSARTLHRQPGAVLGSTHPPRRRPGVSPGRRRARAKPSAVNGELNGDANNFGRGHTHTSVDELPPNMLRKRATSADRLGASMPAPGRPASPLSTKRSRDRMELIAQIYGIGYTKGPGNSLQLEKTTLPRYYAVQQLPVSTTDYSPGTRSRPGSASRQMSPWSSAPRRQAWA